MYQSFGEIYYFYIHAIHAIEQPTNQPTNQTNKQTDQLTAEAISQCNHCPSTFNTQASI
jgi:hypothetical protein